MSKITFRADDDLVDELEAFDASKSEVMREALRTFLDERGPRSDDVDQTRTGSVDDLIRARVDELLAERLGRSPDRRSSEISVTVSLDDGVSETDSELWDVETEREHPQTEPAIDSSSDTQCAQCGSTVDEDHVYCPNCGQKAVQRLFCDCGDEVRSDWAFCPGCGRRTPAADVLDSGRGPSGDA
ncbi:zinc ribbon domain-containing protein [Halobacteria archaeon AArc-dxtr1]|nr:zinc ribbon domain-containing protein [Halobacteria archaeon AArc-dxtr1]